MTESDYAFLVAFVKRRSGLSLGAEKRYLVQSRLAPVCRAAGLDGLAELVVALRGGRTHDALATAVADAMATHETLFFRDGTPFEALRRTIFPGFAARRPPGTPIRIWSAAASTGQEAYSIAMLASELGEGPGAVMGGHPVAILASDMAESAVARGRAAVYTQFEVQRGLPIRSLLRQLRQIETGWEVLPDLRAMVEFRVVNLLDDFRRLGRFDIIFCRNLLIYLDHETKRSLLERFAAALSPDGVLCLGSAETAVGLTRGLHPHADARGFFMPVAPVPSVGPAPAHPRAAAVA